MNLNSILLGTDDPERLVEFYTRMFGEPSGSEGGYTWWVLGTGWLTIGAHSQVHGKNDTPGRVIWNLESTDVRGDFERLKAAGATVVAEPYGPEGMPEGTEMLLATFADPDGNYFQVGSPM